MGKKIAIIATDFLEQFIKDMITELDMGFQYHIFTYEKFEDIKDIYKKIGPEYDGILASGSFPAHMIHLYYPEETRPIGFWGMLRKEYLKEHKSGIYTYLLLTARLDSYLADLNEQSQEHFELIEAQMRSAEGVTEELKRQNPMEWVRHCNNIRNRAAEIIKQELIYV